MHSFASDGPNVMLQSIYIMQIGILVALQKILENILCATTMKMHYQLARFMQIV